MNFQDYANLGMAAMTGNPGYARTVKGRAVKDAKEAARLSNLASYAVASGIAGQPAETGWTAPTITYDKMRQTNASALALDADVQRNVSRDAFKTAWAQWLAGWKAFFDKYQGTWSTSAKLGAALYSDELSERAESYRLQLEGWFSGYAREKRADGTAVPAPTAPLPPKPSAGPSTEQNSEGIPWWLISVITVGFLSVGVALVYAVRKAMKDTEAKAEVIERKVLPIVLGSQFGPAGVALAEAAAARAPRNDPDAAFYESMLDDYEGDYAEAPSFEPPRSYGHTPERYVPLHIVSPAREGERY